MTTCLVTGAAGFLGYRLACVLADDPGRHVVCVDNFIRGERDAAVAALAARPNVEFLERDLTDVRALDDLPPAFDYIFHLAALNGTQNFYERPYDVVRCCTLPTLSLLDKYARTPLRRFVYAGTSEAYASTVTRFGWPVPTTEDVPLSIADPFNPRWSYAASKMHGEVATVNACTGAGTPFTIIRYHNAYGPRMGDKHVIPDFLLRARTGVYALYGSEDTRSFIYVDDAVAATIALAESDAAAGEVVNVGGSQEISMATLAAKMMELLGRSEPVVHHAAPSGSVSRRAPDIAKLNRLAGRFDAVSLEDGLRRTIADYVGA